MHKGTIVSTVDADEPPSRTLTQPPNPWITGSVARLPWMPLISFVGLVLGLAMVAYVLVYSDGKPIHGWTWQPPTYIAIAGTVVNMCLAYCLSSGATVWWWRLASSSTTVGDLHRAWVYSHSFQDSILAGRYMNYLALTSIMATLAQINGPLLQRASRVVVEQDSRDVVVTPMTATEIPEGYTGFLSGREKAPSLFTQQFSKIVDEWNNQVPIRYSTDDCKGTCYFVTDVLGFDINCNRSTIPFNLTIGTGSAGTDPIFNGSSVLSSDFAWPADQSGNGPSNIIRLDTSYRATTDCIGDVQVQNCTLQPARVEAHVIINSNSSTIMLDPDFSFEDDVLVKLDDRQEVAAATLPTTAGGLYRALANKYDSSARTRWAGAVGYVTTTEGNLALQYAIMDDTKRISMECGIPFRDPTRDILASSRELMFRIGLQTVNETTQSMSVVAVQEMQVAVFRSEYGFMAGALVITGLAATMVLALFWSYDRLGRAMSLSPLEIAKAFEAPLFKNTDSNAQVGKMVDIIGSMRVKYGVVGSEELPLLGEQAGSRLAIADARAARAPSHGETFTG